MGQKTLDDFRIPFRWPHLGADFAPLGDCCSTMLLDFIQNIREVYECAINSISNNVYVADNNFVLCIHNSLAVNGSG
jgi:hypothetical protein